MDKQDIVSRLKKYAADVVELRRLSYANSDFPRWKNDVEKTLKDIYGDDSPQLKRFEDAPGTYFRVDTEMGRQQSYTYVLEMHESALNTLIQRAEMS